MIVTSKISVDMTRPNPGGRIYAMQGDGNTRCVEVTMLSGDRPWRPPEDVQAEFTYQLPNGEKGIYNTLVDGSPGVQIRGNKAQVMLVPHVLSAAGEVTAAIVLYNKQQDQLTSFPFSICVKTSCFTEAQKTEGYLRVEWMEKMLDAYIAQLPPGENGKSAYEIAVEHGFVGTVEQWLQSLTGPEGDTTAATNAAVSAAESAANAQAAMESIAQELAARQASNYTAAIKASGWTGTNAPYICNVTVTGIQPEDNPMVDILPSTTFDIAQAQLEAYGCIYRIETQENKIVCYGTEKPDVDIPIQIKVVH